MKGGLLLILLVLLVLSVIAEDIPCGNITHPDVVIEATDVPPGFDDNPLTEVVITFVEDAAALVAEKGERAFVEFRKRDSQWFNGDRYVFAWDLEGMRYCYPPDTTGEMMDVSDLQDPAGRPIGRLIIAAATNSEGRGWVHYQWDSPENRIPEWKSTFVMQTTAPNGKKFLVASGLYEADE